MPSRIRCAAILAFVSTGVSLACSFAADTQHSAEAGKPRPSEAIASPTKAERLVADAALGDLRARVFNDLVATCKRDPSRAYLGGRHLAIRQMGRWRFEEATDFLAAEVDWELDKDSVPGGKMLGPYALFPCAIALTNIGGRAVRAKVIRSIMETDNDTRLPLLAWVLCEVDGPPLAQQLLAERLAKVTVESLRHRLEKAIEYARASGVPG